MAAESLYKQVLLDHFHHPRNKGDLTDADAVRRGSNPRCGDEVEVGLYLKDDLLDQVRFRGRGCSVCIASASMMTEAVRGKETREARKLCEAMQGWFGQRAGERVEAGAPAGLEALGAVREYPARRRCVLLSWEALAEAIDSL
jgi:nitrogen fixation NifU-like protein